MAIKIPGICCVIILQCFRKALEGNIMKTKMTASQFENAVNRDPAWASKLTEPVEITEYCDMSGSEITHLSPMLHFAGNDDEENAANFAECNQLKVAEGVFDGFVDFMDSGIEKIGDLVVTKPNENGEAADFTCCYQLQIAGGTYHGSVKFNISGVREIEHLQIIRPNNDGLAASYCQCDKLRIARGVYPGCVDFLESGVETIGDLQISDANVYGDAAFFENCRFLKVAEGTFPGFVDFAGSGLEKIRDLKVTQRNKAGFRADFSKCKSLGRLPVEWYTQDVKMDVKLRKEHRAREILKSQPTREI